MTNPTKIPFFVGSYSVSADHVQAARGEGVYCCTLDINSGDIQHLHTLAIDTDDFHNPAYLDFNDKQTRLYAIAENFSGYGCLHSFIVIENDF